MALDPAKLKDALLASPVAADFEAGNTTKVLAHTNADAGRFIVAASLGPDEYRSLIDMAEFADLPEGHRQAWLYITNNGQETLNPRKAGVRASLEALFGVAATKSVAALTRAITRRGTVGEMMVLVEGSPNGTSSSQPAVPEATGPITRADILAARRLHKGAPVLAQARAKAKAEGISVEAALAAIRGA